MVRNKPYQITMFNMVLYKRKAKYLHTTNTHTSNTAGISSLFQFHKGSPYISIFFRSLFSELSFFGLAAIPGESFLNHSLLQE